jgi:dihydrofolate synthase/folylpolyglutamate synthase
MSIEAALAYLESRKPVGMRFGHETMRALAETLGHPERAYPTLLVAGTNGKGSVVAMVDAALRAQECRVGRYTSPHLVRIQERIAVDGQEIDDGALAEALIVVRDKADVLVRASRIEDHPTFFEALTLAAFLHFDRCKADVAVLEIGLGGRLDATNIAEPLASAVVSVDLDHQEYLGDTLEAIALEKAGVLREGRATVLGPMDPIARHAIERRAGVIGARVVAALESAAIREDGGLVHVRTERFTYAGLRPLPGAYQRRNLAVAIRLLECAEEAGLSYRPDRVATGLAALHWPGRLEWFPGNPPILLDGAHNPAAALVLAEELRPRGPFVLLFGAMRDKDIESIGSTLFPLARQIVLTRAVTERAATPAEIADRVGTLAAGAFQRQDAPHALALARSLAAPGEFVLVTGSLYLVGAVRPLLSRNTQETPVS